MLKSVRSLEIGVNHLWMAKFEGVSDEDLMSYISEFRDDTIYAVAELLRRGKSVDELHKVTLITAYFLESIKKICDFENIITPKIKLIIGLFSK